MRYKVNIMVPPQKVTYSGLDGQPHRGYALCGIESSDGLSQYVLLWNHENDKYELYQKVHLDPEQPSDYTLRGVDHAPLLNEISYDLKEGDMWPLLENCVEIARKQEREEDERSTD